MTHFVHALPPKAAPTAARPTPSQIRGARGMLGWSMGELAREARVSVSTVKRVEGGPIAVTDETVMAIALALARAGIAFLPDDGEGAGLRIRHP